MTRFGESKFTVGSTSKKAQKNFADNYDRIFGRKQTVDPLKSLSEEEYEKLVPPTEEDLQAALDEGRPDRRK